MKKMRKLCALLLGTAMILGNTCYAAEIVEDSPSAEVFLTEEKNTADISGKNIGAEEQITADIAYLEEMLPAERKDLPSYKQQKVDEIVSLFEKDALSAAKSLNQISDEKTYEAALHEILDNYYGEESSLKEGQISAFSENIDDRAEETLANYAEAKAERDNQENLNYETGKVMAIFEAGTTDEEIGEIAGRIGEEYHIISNFDIDETLPEDKLKRLKACGTQEFPVVVSIGIGLDKTVSRAGAMLETLSCVTDASENNIDIEPQIAELNAELGVNDPKVWAQDYLTRIKVPGAWESWSRSGSDANYAQPWVAVIDTGLDTDHPDLKNMYIPERSVAIDRAGNGTIEIMNKDNRYYPEAVDANHGTHVTGIIAAQSNNNIGVVGIDSIVDKTHAYSFSGCRIIAINASSLALNDDKELSCYFKDDDIAKAIYHAVNNGADVINMSLGGKDKHPGTQTAIDYAHANNVIVCAASGNAKKNKITGLYEDLDVMRYPASCNHVVSVANLNGSEYRYEDSVYNAAVDLAAPGTRIYNCILNDQTGHYENGYDFKTGTSMATPMVSAGMAMIRAILPNATADTVENVLTSTATDLYSSGRDDYTGYGLINLELAVQTAKKQRLNATSPQSLTASPTNYQSVKLSWQAVDWAEQYIVFRSTSADGTYTKIKHLSSTEGEYLHNNKWVFTDTNCDTGTTYYYKVRATSVYKDGFAFTGFSPVVSAKCTLAAPGGLALAAAKGKITASWNKVAGATGYRVFRATSKTGTYTRIKSITNGNTLSYADTSVTAGKTYYYKVRAYRTVNGKDILSDFSTIVGKKAL
jgi:subtilisin family serine protease